MPSVRRCHRGFVRLPRLGSVAVGPVDLALTDEQQALVTSVTDLLNRHSTPDRVRKAEDTGLDQELWTALQDTGLVTMAGSERVGGWGAELLDLALVAESLGAALAPAPVLEAQCAVRLLDRLQVPGSSDSLAAMLSGQRLVTLALRPAAGHLLRAVGKERHL